MAYGWPFSEMDPSDAAHEEYLAAQDRADAAADRRDDFAPSPARGTDPPNPAAQAAAQRIAATYELVKQQWRRYADADTMAATLDEIRDLPEAS